MRIKIGVLAAVGFAILVFVGVRELIRESEALGGTPMDPLGPRRPSEWLPTAETSPTDVETAATSTEPTVVDVTWTAATDNKGVVGYDVCRNGIVIASTTTEVVYEDAQVDYDTDHN